MLGASRGWGEGTQLSLPSSRKALSSHGGHLLITQSPLLQRKAASAFQGKRNLGDVPAWGSAPAAPHSLQVAPPGTDPSQTFCRPPCLSLPMERTGCLWAGSVHIGMLGCHASVRETPGGAEQLGRKGREAMARSSSAQECGGVQEL